MTNERLRALMINALGFPGMGQLLVLGRRRAGWALVVVSLVALVGVSWAFVGEILMRLPDTSPERLLVAPWELLSAFLEALRSPGRAVLGWGVLLAFGWLLALLDVLLCKHVDTGDTAQGNQ